MPPREHLALNVYVALCYYKLDYYDVSQEVLAVYLQHYPDSAIAINLKVRQHKEKRARLSFPRECFVGLQSFPAVQWQGRRARTQDAAGPDLVLVQFRQGSHRAQLGRFQEWRRRPPSSTVSGGRHPRGASQPRVRARSIDLLLCMIRPKFKSCKFIQLNFRIYFLRQDDVNEAYSLIKDLEPTVPQV